MHTWFGPVLIGAGLVFLISLVGAYIEFNNRLVNAIVDAVLFLIVFGLIVYFWALRPDGIDREPLARS
jgi:hypothetical protein